MITKALVALELSDAEQPLLIGSTAAALCEIARRPVLMVPHRGRET